MDKRMFAAGLTLAVMLSFYGCSDYSSDQNNSGIIDYGKTEETVSIPSDLSATAASALTKTVMDNATMVTSWTDGDKLNVWHAPAGTTDYVEDSSFDWSSGNGFSGELRAELTEASYDWYVFYPYSMVKHSPAGTGMENTGAVSVGSASQVQKTNDDLSHVSSYRLPQYGIARSVSSSTIPSVQMKHLAAVIEIDVTSSSGSVTVDSLSLTAPVEIVGTYYIDITGDTPVYKPISDNMVSRSVKLAVQNPVALSEGETGKFYIAVCPFSVSAGDEFEISVNGKVEKLTMESAVYFEAGSVKTLDCATEGISVDPDPGVNPGTGDLEGVLSGTFTVSADGKKVKFSRGNLYWDSTNSVFALEEKQNATTPSETGDAASWTSTHVSHFMWSTDASVARAGSVESATSYATSSKLFAADGGAIEGWTVLTNAEWDYLVNGRTVGGGTGNGYTYYNCCNSKSYRIDGKLVRGLLIYPDDYTGNRDESTWDDINAAGILYLPAGGARNATNNWVNSTKFKGWYLTSDITTEGSFNYFYFNSDTATSVGCKSSSTFTNALSIRLVTVVE